MKIFDFYIVKIFFGFWIGGLVVFATLYLTVDALGMVTRYTDVGMGAFVRYYAFSLPALIYQLFPVICLFAVLFTLSQLNRSNELVALYSMGNSLFRVALPVLLSVLFLSLVFFGISDRIFPRLALKKKYVEYVEIKQKPGAFGMVKTNRIWYRSENTLFNIKVLNPQESTAQGVTLYYFNDAWDLVQLISAKTVAMQGSLWKLKDGLITIFLTDSSFPLTQSFQAKNIVMNEEVSDLQSASDSSDQMSLGQLGRFIERNREAGLETTSYEVDYHSKFSFALAALVMSILGLPFAVERVRSGGGFKNVGICLGLAFLYWSLYSSFLTLGKYGALPPFLAAWTPNLLTIGASVVLYKRLNR
ncbi:MAG: LPS export ABC transporter permease LptG [Bdellovibrionaceae bacterium]|nr:LPS export ABC transporter permease LptG [Pseudobdellovibrionaceae bacterium]|tara:strand:- start:194 stop:1273 length:1080 start_codon:yes stop_codon:yes gene_type:complete